MEKQKTIYTGFETTAEMLEITSDRVGVNDTVATLERAVRRAGQKAAEEGEKAAVKKMGGVFKSMLLQQGLPENEATELTTEWVAGRQTMAQHIAQRDAHIAELQYQLDEMRRKELIAEKKAFFVRKFEEEGLHPHAAKLILRFIDFEKMELRDGKVEQYEDFMAPLREECAALFACTVADLGTKECKIV